MKKSPISTKYRLRDYECIAGSDKTLTMHKEFGCEFRVDLSKAYFSPRLSFEHDRIASDVIEGEIIIDMFSGVGPFSILIAKRYERIKVYAVDINPVALKYLIKNIVHNKVKRKVTAIFGDAKYISTKHFQNFASRIIMNLPSESLNYVRFACNAIRRKGGIIHFYTFMDDSGLLEDKIKELKEEISSSNRNLGEIIYTREIKEIAPHRKQIVIDAKIV
jgi:tRNA (guanine37-N1)-methyltransferase